MKKPFMTRLGERLPALMFGFGLVFFSVLYGMAATEFRLFPYHTLLDVHQLPRVLFPQHRPFFWEFATTDKDAVITVHEPARMQPGLTKIVQMEGDLSLTVKAIDSEGSPHQHWRIEWFEIFPEAPDYLKDATDLPRSRPGTHIHGAEILANGDLVFNFEHLSLVRLNPCGEVVWTLPFRTHHSIFVDDDGNLWVSGQVNHQEPLEQFPFMVPPIIEPVILKVSPEGEILEQKPVFQLLADNQLQGMLYSTSVVNFAPLVRDDLLHLNDVEVFPSDMTPGFFQPGDIMISLRNVNAVLVFDRNWQLKYQWTQGFVRQHDPDFIDGNSIMLLDNNNVGPVRSDVASRILQHDASSGTTRVVFEGSAQTPFFTNIMGKQQLLENGNLLIAESVKGRAFELSPDRDIVWEYNNLAEPGWAGIMEEAERLPLAQNSAFFEKARARCEAAAATGTP